MILRGRTDLTEKKSTYLLEVLGSNVSSSDAGLSVELPHAIESTKDTVVLNVTTDPASGD
jgi:hypothetical protein